MDIKIVTAIILMVASVAYLIWIFIDVFAEHLFSTQLTRNIASVGFVAWVGITGFVASEGLIRDFSTTPPQFAFVMIPTFAMLFALIFTPRFRRRSKNIPLEKLIAYQWFRFPIEIMLYLLAAASVTPKEMTFEGWNFDIIIGVTAPLIAWLYLKKKINLAMSIFWNLLGLVLVSIVTITGMLSAPTQFQQFHTSPANTFIVSFPFIWLAAIAVPMAMLGHVCAFRRA
ncbi:MAG: hypothetical protein HQ472_06500 [Ignavibacteria bacterium]|nr:hypothetical protein [Ignavibacteria bacterium]